MLAGMFSCLNFEMFKVRSEEDMLKSRKEVLRDAIGIVGF